jgi:hypothetical protein
LWYRDLQHDLDNEEHEFDQQNKKNYTSLYKSQFSSTRDNQQPSYSSTLDRKIELARAKLESIAPSGDVTRYDQDDPVTVYSEKAATQGPNQLGTGIYHSAATGKQPFAKNTNFSVPITEYTKNYTKD